MSDSTNGLLSDLKLYSNDPNNFISQLKKIFELKQNVNIDVRLTEGQKYCEKICDIISDKYRFNDEANVIDVISDALFHHVTDTNIRWFFLDKCQLLHLLTKKFISTDLDNVKIRIGKTMQTYFIYSRIDETSCLITTDLVAQLLRNLVLALRGNNSADFNEMCLGLLASLCQIWSNCTQVMNVIDDYQILRKLLLRFLSSEMVKRTTIVYTMTIMFHLCNSDDRLFNKRNIRQTLQVLFNIMLNAENSWASLYAATLLTEICSSTRTCHLLPEYKNLLNSVKETLCQLGIKEKIVVEKFLEFILTLSSLSSDYRHLIMTAITAAPNTSASSGIESDNSETNCPFTNLIGLLTNNEMSICICSSKILDDVYMEVYSSNLRDKDSQSKLPYLSLLANTIYQFLSDIIAQNLSVNQMINYAQLIKICPSENLSKEACQQLIDQRFKINNCLTYLNKVKHVLQLMTNLLVVGNQWMELMENFVGQADKIIRYQLESNILVCGAANSSNNQFSQTINSLLVTNPMLLKITSLSVEVFIDMLYFYYRATELRPNSNIFGERLKSHLEHSVCPVMLAFALSAATQNQTTLQRALILQGVCLHLTDFNVELMGEKMYLFSNYFQAKSRALAFSGSTVSSCPNILQCNSTNHTSIASSTTAFTTSRAFCTNETATTASNADGDNSDMMMANNDENNNENIYTLSNSAIASNSFVINPSDCNQSGDVINYHQPLPLDTSQQAAEVCANHNDLLSVQISSVTNHNKNTLQTQAPAPQLLDNYNYNNTCNETPSSIVTNAAKSMTTSNTERALVANSSLSTSSSSSASSNQCPDTVTLQQQQQQQKITLHHNYNKAVNCSLPDQINLDVKVQQIVKHWMQYPDMNFTTAEVYAIFEHKLQSMQNQETLMEEIISNKTAALHQSEALLNQYRMKLTSLDKENKQLRTSQIEQESKLESLNTIIEQNNHKIRELEKINQTLIETNRLCEQQKQDALLISKKLQEKLCSVNDEKTALDKTVQDLHRRLDESNKIIGHKDNQISNYTNVTKLINKLTGNRLPAETFLNSQMSVEELQRRIATPINNNCNNSSASFSSSPTATTNSNYNPSNNPSSPEQLEPCKTPTFPQMISNPQSGANNINNHFHSNNNNSQNSPSSSSYSSYSSNRSSISSSDFLQLYKNNCRILQNHK